MDETSRDKLSGAMCDFLSNIIHIADEGNYERDSFVKASTEMFKMITEISTFENFKVKDRQVRCKDCVHSHRIDGAKEEYDCRKLSYFSERLPPYHFCSYGEKMNGGANNG